MAAGEYVSVSSQRDVELADLARERAALATAPEAEQDELVEIYVKKGLSRALAKQVASELVRAEEPLRVHAREELRLDPDELAAPGQAAIVSALSFAVGAALPLAAISLSPDPVRRARGARRVERTPGRRPARSRRAARPRGRRARDGPHLRDRRALRRRAMNGVSSSPPRSAA
jgi:hypothetical protein